MAKALKVGSLIVEPSKMASTEIEVAQDFNGNPLTMRVVVFNGSNPGPKVLIDGGVHGNEVGGVEAANKLISTIDPKTLSGSLIITPCVNASAFSNGTRKSPIDEKDLNRIFPGDPEGTFSDRLAYEFYKLVTSTLTAKDIHISLHGAGAVTYIEVPEIPGEIGEISMKLAAATGAGVIEIIEKGGFWDNAYIGTIGNALEKSGIIIPGITIESEDHYESLLNVLKYLKMIKGDFKPLAKERLWLREGRRIYAKKRGLWIPKAEAGTFIKEKQPFAVVTSMRGDLLEDIRSPTDAYIISIRRESIIDPLSGVFATPGNYGGLMAKLVKKEKNEIQNYV